VSRSRRNRGSQTSHQQTWRRIDLHIHTPGSKDYQETDKTYLDILKKAESEKLDIIAFTDHNTVAGYAAMRQEISDLERWQESGRATNEEKQRLSEYHRLLEKILVLPGFELTATFGFHVLAIYDPGTTVRMLEHVLLELNVPLESLERGETEVGATVDVLTAYRIMAESGALVIGAHANSTNGVAMMRLGFGGQTRISYTQDPHLHALEVTDLESTRRRTTATFFNGSKPEYPRRMHCIQGSDSHRITGSGKDLGVGERPTEVQLSEVSFQALVELFQSTDFARTRPYRREASPYDHVAAARRQGPSIVQSFQEGMTRRGGRMHAILRDVVAFANTNGGTIYVGISPNRKVPPKGVENVEASVEELRSEISRLVSPPIKPSLSVLETENKPVIRVVVPKGTDQPYVLEGSNIYVRQEAETSLALRDEIIALISRALSVKPTPQAAPAAQPKARPEPARESRPAKGPSRRSTGEPAAPAPQPRTPPASAPVGQVDAPRTGVEIVASEDRDGTLYHTMRDLRDGGQVHNVTRTSARRLWRYAIALKEKKTFDQQKVTWKGERGMWHKYLRAGRSHYDLVEKAPSGEMRVFYGVTEEGIHGPWRDVVGIS